MNINEVKKTICGPMIPVITNLFSLQKSLRMFYKINNRNI